MVLTVLWYDLMFLVVLPYILIENQTNITKHHLTRLIAPVDISLAAMLPVHHHATYKLVVFVP